MHTETQVQFLGQEYLLEKGMDTHYTIIAWRIPWTEESGEPQSKGSQRVRCDLMTNTFTFYICLYIYMIFIMHIIYK